MSEREFSIRLGAGRVLSYLGGFCVGLIVLFVMRDAIQPALITTAAAITCAFIYAQNALALAGGVADHELTRLAKRLERLERR